jgi:hypothetical protein
MMNSVHLRLHNLSELAMGIPTAENLPKKRGMKPLPEEQRRTIRIDVNLNPAEHQSVMGKAEAAGLAIRQYLRKRLGLNPHAVSRRS